MAPTGALEPSEEEEETGPSVTPAGRAGQGHAHVGMRCGPVVRKGQVLGRLAREGDKLGYS